MIALLDGAESRLAGEPDGFFASLKKALAERELNAEIGRHLADDATGNSHIDYGRKAMIVDTSMRSRDRQVREASPRSDPMSLSKGSRGIRSS